MMSAFALLPQAHCITSGKGRDFSKAIVMPV